MSTIANSQALATFMYYLPCKKNPSDVGNGANRHAASRPENGGNVEWSMRQETSSNNEDSGYNSEISDNVSDGGLVESFFEESDDIHERIDFIKAKQEILCRANDILFNADEDLLIAQNASKKYQSFKTRTSKVGKQGKRYCNVDLSLPSAHASSTIWEEARDTLQKINNNTANVCSQSLTEDKSLNNAQKCAPSPRDPSIRLAGVNCLASTTFEDRRTSAQVETGNVLRSDGLHNMSSTGSFSAETPEDVIMEQSMFNSIFAEQAGHWMAKALVRSGIITRASRKRKLEQEVENDSGLDAPEYSPLSSEGMGCRQDIPFSSDVNLSVKAPFFRRSSVDIKTATAPQELQPRLVTQVTPPFLVVYANRAFIELIGPTVWMNDSRSIKSGLPSNLIGQPVESLVQVIRALDRQEEKHPQVIDNSLLQLQDDEKSNPRSLPTGPKCLCFDSVLIPNGKGCRVELVPVVDQSFMRAGTGASRCITHLMVQVVPSSFLAEEKNEVEVKRRKHDVLSSRTGLIIPIPMRIVMATNTNDKFMVSSESHSTSDLPSEQPSEHHTILGTVG